MNTRGLLAHTAATGLAPRRAAGTQPGLAP